MRFQNKFIQKNVATTWIKQEPDESLRGISYKKNGKHWLINDDVKIHSR